MQGGKMGEGKGKWQQLCKVLDTTDNIQLKSSPYKGQYYFVAFN